MIDIRPVQRRIHDRIMSSLYIKFSFSDEEFSGIVRNISEKGMCINSGICFPVDTMMDLHLPLKETNINLPVVVKWAMHTEGFYDIMGVELVSPSRKYLRMLNNIRSSQVTV